MNKEMEFMKREFDRVLTRGKDEEIETVLNLFLHFHLQSNEVTKNDVVEVDHFLHRLDDDSPPGTVLSFNGSKGVWVDPNPPSALAAELGIVILVFASFASIAWLLL